MVLFGLFATKKMTTLNKSKDILDELMDLDNTNYNRVNQHEHSLNTSSFNLSNIIKNLPTKSNTDYTDALLNTLYAQVDFLRQESLNKTEIIQALINNSVGKHTNTVENSNNSTKVSPNNLEPITRYTINSSMDTSLKVSLNALMIYLVWRITKKQ